MLTVLLGNLFGSSTLHITVGKGKEDFLKFNI